MMLLLLRFRRRTRLVTVDDSLLAALGWTGSPPPRIDGLGRVSVVHGPSAEVYGVDPQSERWMVREGVRFSNTLPLTPVAGDWVRVEAGVITMVWPRTTALGRPSQGGTVRQTLAANLDVVIVAVPIDLGLNVRMTERLAVMAWDSGAVPVITLTKCDACPDVPGVVSQAQDLVPGVEVLPTSAITGEGLRHLESVLGNGSTGCLLGASGVGKTSLLNSLGGFDEAVYEVRSDGQGRHTTTTRKLHLLPNGGILIDIPGLRSLELDVGADALGGVFSDISTLEGGCRFSDCTHSHEPDCAIKAAVVDGELSEARVHDWGAIQREMAHQNRKSDPLARAREKAKWKAVSKAHRSRDHG